MAGAVACLLGGISLKMLCKQNLLLDQVTLPLLRSFNSDNVEEGGTTWSCNNQE